MRILIAEDDPVSRRVLQATLQKLDHVVAATCDGQEAWAALQGADAPTLAIIDWMMPGMDGLELTRCIRSSPRPGYVYAILLTSMSTKKDVVRGMVAGADECVTKPFDHE